MAGLLTTSELAELLHVSPAWVSKQAADSALPGYRVAGSWRFDSGEVAAWLARAGNPPTRAPQSLRQVLPETARKPLPAPVRLETALPAEDVAEALGVTRDRVRGWVQGGLLPGVSAGTACVVDRDGFEQWLLILGGTERVARWERGRERTVAIRCAIEAAMLDKRSGGLSQTPESLRRSGGRIPRWSEVFPSGRR
ncbi:MAG TPA: helix-turn-helix domain-containing protein [Propionicimonas sp.]|jgi:excisionase family DNA binding protein